MQLKSLLQDPISPPPWSAGFVPPTYPPTASFYGRKVAAFTGFEGPIISDRNPALKNHNGGLPRNAVSSGFVFSPLSVRWTCSSRQMRFLQLANVNFECRSANQAPLWCECHLEYQQQQKREKRRQWAKLIWKSILWCKIISHGHSVYFPVCTVWVIERGLRGRERPHTHRSLQLDNTITCQNSREGEECTLSWWTLNSTPVCTGNASQCQKERTLLPQKGWRSLPRKRKGVKTRFYLGPTKALESAQLATNLPVSDLGGGSPRLLHKLLKLSLISFYNFNIFLPVWQQCPARVDFRISRSEEEKTKCLTFSERWEMKSKSGSISGSSEKWKFLFSEKWNQNLINSFKKSKWLEIEKWNLSTKVRTLTYFGMEIHNGENVNLLRVNSNFLEGKWFFGVQYHVRLAWWVGGMIFVTQIWRDEGRWVGEMVHMPGQGQIRTSAWEVLL